MTVLAGSIVATLAVTGSVGTPLSFPILAVALALFAVGYAAMTRYVSNAGAFYTYIAQGLGRTPGVGASFVALLAYNAIQIALYGLLGLVMSAFATQHWHLTWAWWVWALIGWAAVGVLGILKVDLNARVLAFLLVVEVLAVLAFDLGAFTHPAGGAVSLAGLDPRRLSWHQMGGVFAFGIAAFVGFESAPTYSEEAKQKSRTVARATYAAIAITGVLYTVSAWALTVGAGPDTVVGMARDPNSGIPFNLIAGAYGQAGNAMALVANTLLITSVFAALLSFHNVVARYTYSAALEGVLPHRLAATSARSAAPWAGSLLQSACAIAVVATFAALGRNPLSELFTWLSYVAAVGVLLLMFGTSIAVIGFFRRADRTRGLEGAWQRTTAPALATLALGAITYVTVTNASSVLGTGTTSPLVWILPGMVFAAAVAGALWALVLRTVDPRAYRAIGQRGVTPAARSAGWHDVAPFAPSHR
ncbi:MAG TPA: APC family permease, partial [Rugosimonospora sp.]|nr:APC family permease [Rugosimonospora sp.]